MNVYATLSQARAALDLDPALVAHDDLLLAHLRRASRLVEAAAGRSFAPRVATRDLDGNGRSSLWLPESLLARTTISLSDDLGATYTALATTDVWLSDGITYDKPPYQLLVINPNGVYGAFATGRRTVRIAGVWGWHDDYDLAWQATGQSTTEDPLSSSATALAVTVGPGAPDRTQPAFQVGQLLRLGSEYLLVTQADLGADSITGIRGYNGSTAATHVTGTVIEMWQPHELASQATLIQAIRWYKRGLQAYADAGSIGELGQLAYVKKLDPDVEAILFAAGLRRVSVG